MPRSDARRDPQGRGSAPVTAQRAPLRRLLKALHLSTPDSATAHRPRRRLRRAAVAIAAGLTLTLGMAACTAGTAASGGPAADTGESAQAGDSTKRLNYFPCCAWQTTWSYNPYNVNGLNGVMNSFIVMPLAIQNFPSLTDYTPQLADKWTEDGDTLSIHLREDAKWQDDTPVTSQDFYDTVILNGTRGDGFWNDITDVEIVDDHTVAFTLKEGQPMDLAKNDILGMYIYPSSVYGEFATEKLAKDVKTYFRASHENPEKASKMGEFKRMGDAFKELAAHEVDELIGNGPFTLENITTKEAKLDKWDGFWAADKIKFAGINWSNGDNQAVYPQLLSGNADFSNVYMPPPLLKQWKGVENSQMALPLAFGFMLGINSSHPPLDQKEVRQALAYVIPRQQMAEAAYGTEDGAGGTWKEINSGISPSLEKLYLTDDQLGQLNKYPVDEAKATELLESKGFTKKGDQWMMPNGKPFTLTFTVNSATSDIVTSFTSASKALTAFGIKSEVNATSGAQQDADQHNGDFELGMYLIGGNNPLGVYNSIMGPGQNFSKSGNYAGKRGIGFGPKMEDPGQGTVDIPTTLQNQVNTVAPGQEMKDLTWSWAQLVNEEVPYIWYATKVYQFSYSTTNFDNWPPVDETGTSELWDIIGNNTNAGISLAMQQGYITPKS